MPDEEVPSAPVVIYNTIMLTMHGLLDGRDFVHVFNYRCLAAPTNAQVIAVGQWAYTTLLPQLRAISSNHLTWTHAIAKSVHAPGGYQYEQPFSTNNQGTRGTVAAPANVCGVANWHTASSGRNYQGKTFFGAFDARDGDNSVLQPVIMQLLTALLQWMLTHVPATGVVLSVGSRKLHIATPVNGFALNNSSDDIGRRLIGHGS